MPSCSCAILQQKLIKVANNPSRRRRRGREGVEWSMSAVNWTWETETPRITANPSPSPSSSSAKVIWQKPTTRHIFQGVFKLQQRKEKNENKWTEEEEGIRNGTKWNETKCYCELRKHWQGNFESSNGRAKISCAPHLNSKRILQTEDYFIFGRVLYLHERLKTLSSPLSFTKKFLCAANMSVLSALDPRITSNTPQLPVLSQRKPQEKK